MIKILLALLIIPLCSCSTVFEDVSGVPNVDLRGESVVVAGLLNPRRPLPEEEDHPVYKEIIAQGIQCYLGDHAARATQLICGADDVDKVLSIIESLPVEQRRLVGYIQSK